MGFKSNIAKAKSSHRSYYQYKNSRNLLISGSGIEVDETVLCRRVIIKNLTSLKVKSLIMFGS